MMLIRLPLSGQPITQVVKGKIMDKETLMPIAEATAVLDPGAVHTYTTYSNSEGEFYFEHIPVGYHQMVIYHPDYQPAQIKELWVSSGKELVIEVEMHINLTTLGTVEITDSRIAARNEFIHVSHHVLDPANALRYAGSFRDPARMMAYRAGITQLDDSRNDLVVRGNSPAGVSWQIEGIETINPNHFATAGNSGGSMNILNPYTLAKSEFMTGAFPAQYGNALSAVFDVSLRNGNNSKHEYHFRTSLADVEAGIEGPINREKKSSFIAAYRRANLDLAYKINPWVRGYLGNTPNMDDFTFKLYFPAQKGWTSAYGIWGMSELRLREGFETINEEVFNTQSLTTGVSHLRFVGKKSYLKIAAAYARNHTRNGNVNEIALDSLRKESIQSKRAQYTLAFTYNNRPATAHAIRLGLHTHFIQDEVTLDYQNPTFYRHAAKNYLRTQAFFQWKWKFQLAWTLQAGLHAMYVSLNQGFHLGPRLSVSWQLHSNQKLAFAWGIHSQTQPGGLYLSGYTNRDGIQVLPNVKLGFSKSQHFILSYSCTLLNIVQARLEAYYLHHYQIPVFNNPLLTRSFSGLNLGYNFGYDYFTISAKAENLGKGRSYGLELTLERAYENNLYFLFTASLYQARYTTYDAIERNTAFNGNFACNFLMGKEFELGANQKNLLSIDMVVKSAGGRRYTPPGQDERAFEKQYKSYFRSDVKVGFHQNFRKFEQQISVDVRNIFNTKNVLAQTYNPDTDQTTTYYQLGLLPLLSYEINF
ncbi:MAG: hypothetical protein D6730_19350 [Bacteroidetes bacterium]|nr:MAG: hypothetical protein D6730_19350 [Bacteroidota bacterium]